MTESLIGPDSPGDLHVVPVGGKEPLHEGTRACWCYPTEDPGDRSCVVHNAKDLRDAHERLGRPTGLPWVIFGPRIKGQSPE